MGGEKPLRGDRPRRAWVRIAVVLSSLAAVALLARRAAPRVGARLIEGALPWPAANVHIGRIDVHGWRGLTAVDVRITPDPHGDTLSLDTLTADYALGDMLRAPRRIRRLRLVGLRIAAVRTDSGWPWLAPFSGVDGKGNGRQTGPPALLIDRLELDIASLIAIDRAGRRLLGLELLDVGGAITIGPVAGGRLDPAGLRVEASRTWNGRVSARADLADGVWRVGSVELVDARGGRLAVSGTIGPRGPNGAGLDLDISGHDLRIADFYPSLAALVPPSVELAASVRGTTQEPELDATVDFGEAGLLRTRGRLERSGAVTVLELHATPDSIRFERLRTSPLAIGPVGGTVDARLTLGDGDSLTGPIHVNLRSLDDRPIHLSGRADFTGRAAEVRLDAVGRDIEARLRGRVHGTSTAPTWRFVLTGRASLPLPPSVLSAEPSLQGPWGATVRVAGAGASLDSLHATLEARLEPVEATPRAGAVLLTGRVADRSIALGVRGVLGGGTIDAAGTVRLGTPSRWTLDRLSLREVAIGSGVGDRGLGRLDGGINARGTTNGAKASLTIDSLRGGSLDGLAGVIDVDATGGEIDVRGRLERHGAVVELERIELSRGALRRANIAMSGIDPASLVSSLPDGNVNGRLALEPVDATDVLSDTLPGWARTSVSGRLDLSDSELGGEPVGGGVDLRFVHGELGFDVDLKGEARSLTVAGAARPFDRPVALRVDSGRFRNIDLSPWLGRVAEGGVTGRFAGSATGTKPASARADLTVSLDSARVGRVVVDGGAIDLSLRDGKASIRVAGTGGTRATHVEADATIGSGGAWRGGGMARVASSVPAETLAVRFEFVTPSSLERGGWRALVEGGGALSGLRLDSLAAEVEGVDGGLTIARLIASGPTLSIRGRGQLPRRGGGEGSANLSIDGATSDLGSVLSLAGRPGYRGRAAFAFRSRGPARELRHELRFGVTNLRGSRVAMDSAEVTVTATSDSLAWVTQWTVVARAVGPLFSVGSIPVMVGLGARNDGVGATRVEATAEWNAQNAAAGTLSTFVALVDGRTWRLRAPATVSWRDGVAVDELVVRGPGGGTIEARGHVDRRGAQDLAVDVVGLPLHAVPPGGEKTLGGSADVSLRLSGPASRPRLVAEGRARTEDGGTPLTFHADWIDDALEVGAELAPRERSHVSVDGTLPLRLALAEGERVGWAENDIDLRAEIVDLDLAALQPVATPLTVRDLRGMMNGAVRISGRTSAVQLDGDVAVATFGIRLENYGTQLASDRLAVTLRGNRLTVVDGELRSPRRGTLRLSGGVALPELRRVGLDLQASFDHFAAANSRALTAVVSGTLAVRGTIRAPALNGQLRIDEGTYSISGLEAPVALEPIELTQADYRELEERFGVEPRGGDRAGAATWKAATVDVSVEVLSGVWVRRSFEPALAVELEGQVHVTKAPGAEPNFDGMIRIVEGRSFVEEFGRRFDLAEGSVGLSGPLSASTLQAVATYQPTSDVTIRLNVSGDGEGFSVELGSDPPLDRADIVSYIAVGRPRSNVTGVGEVGGDVAGLGADIAMSRLTGEIEDVAQRSLGLDVVEVRQDGLKGLTLVAGRYPSRRLFLGFQQPVVFQGKERKGFGIDDTEVDAEYRVSEWLLANLSGSRSLARFFLGVRHAY